jgi:hypothetical protein
LALPTIGQSQSVIPDHDKKIEVMILGTSHFGNPGQDVINSKFPDVLKPKYQKQINRVVDSLSGFSPTKIALEVQPDYKAKFDSLYHAYVKGNHQLTRNERQQLGFRLGNRFEHSQLYSIDHKGNFPFREVIDYAKKHNPEFISYFESIKSYVKSTDDSLYSSANIREILRFNNSPKNLQIQRNYYAQTAAVGTDSTWVGANLVAEWHHRNIKIFGDLASIAQPGDRIIVIFGTGHAPLLRYFVESSLKMKLIEPNDYL